MAKYNWIISQIGARQHYGVPRGFEYLGGLKKLYTDVWCAKGHSLLRKLGRLGRAFAGRHHSHIPNSKIVSFNAGSFYNEFKAKRCKTTDPLFHQFIKTGSWFASKVRDDIAKNSVLDPDKDCFFGFNTACLETQQYLKDIGVINIVDQIDPGKFEEDLVHEESIKWPGWQKLEGRIPDEYFKRLAQEWDLADLILVNSQWSKNALIHQGVPDPKIIIVPLAYEPTEIHVLPKNPHDGPLCVLWLGQVNLRKGIQYLIQAAKLLIHENIQFIVAGHVDLTPLAMETVPPNMEFVGRVTRDLTAKFYRQADVFVLPTLSDGFAITQIEAMGFGLPVVTTPNCGVVVDHNVDGLIVPAADAQSLADALLRLEKDRKHIKNMSLNALLKSTQFRLPAQAEGIERAVVALKSGATPAEIQRAIDTVPK
jgi:glycosyltransferase involved in cell wall biosynthesis